jgi:hypothetical protein
MENLPEEQGFHINSLQNWHVKIQFYFYSFKYKLFKKWDGEAWTGLNWLGIGTDGEHL